MFKILDGRSEFYQWDVDRKIVVSDPAIDEVHFCNKTDDCSLVVEVYELEGLRVANVPNILLQSNWDIRVYGYCGECYTKQAARFKVVGRTKPSDYVYTETEVKRWEDMAERCEAVLEVAESLAHGASGGKSFMDYRALIEDLNNAGSKKYFNPQHFFIKTLNVPDVWVYEVTEEKIPYEYVDDQTFADAITVGLVQVGYYVLSALETQKVVLTDYYSKEEAKENFVSIPSDLPTFGSQYLVTINGATKATEFRNISYSNAAPTPYAIPLTAADGVLSVGSPKETFHAVNKEYADANYVKVPANLPSSGASFIPTITGNTKAIGYLSMSYSDNPAQQYALAYTGKDGVLSVGTPTEDFHAANKKYVDDAIAGVDVSGQLADCVKNTDIATADTAGVVRVSGLDYGIEIVPVGGSSSIKPGTLQIRPASDWNIVNGRSGASRSPVTLSKVDKVVKEVMINPLVEMTAADQTKACAWIGAATTAEVTALIASLQAQIDELKGV